MEYCRYIHFELEDNEPEVLITTILPEKNEPQWINCDIRSFDYRVLGNFDIIMADPPWFFKFINGYSFDFTLWDFKRLGNEIIKSRYTLRRRSNLSLGYR